ncbi:serine hydrolase domain-containing protein [Cytobacillus sp. IB215316]|uniref:serine hydrolase domain-containing protein n=1 Tax=Cytobacillus sp. IB215316 TaxID=3097354 RepID=UPI002A11A0A6|nr:serine hydrolase domain-containing protein [Cytobacillus sp. IB215316]MDX8363452.1 serine hydrolase domain-containing protein [Cytobacillus sp. IB215316]
MKKSLFIMFISFSFVLSACSTENSTKKGNELLEKLHLSEETTVENTTQNQVRGVSQNLNNLDLYSKLDKAVTRYEEYYDFSGAVYVGMDDEEIFSKTSGMANYDQDVPNTLDTKFLIGSLTKQFTAAAILILEEKGLLELDHQVTDYIPEATQWEEITIHHLLSMSSGIVNTDHPHFIRNIDEFLESSENNNMSNISPLLTPEESIAIYKDIPLNFKPGERYEYSNSNYLVLGLIIELTSGDPYETFLEENIFEPLGMLNSGYSIDWDNQQNKAIGWYKKNNSENKFYPVQAEYFHYHSAGGLYSTINDLKTWNRALYSEELLKKETIDKMYSPYTKTSIIEYGYGWFTKGDSVEHSGSVPGFISHIYRELDTELVIIILSNNESLVGGILDTLTNNLEELLKANGDD